MWILYLSGLILLILAFVAAAAEGVSHGADGITGIVVPFHDVLVVLLPDGLVSLQVALTRGLGAWAWDPVVVSLLSLPGWLLFGVPGGVLAWRYRPPSGEGAEGVDDDPHALFEALARDAEREGYTDTDADLGGATMKAADITPVPIEANPGPSGSDTPLYNPDPPENTAEDTEGMEAIKGEVPTPMDPPPPLEPHEKGEDDVPPYNPEPADPENAEPISPPMSPPMSPLEKKTDPGS